MSAALRLVPSAEPGHRVGASPLERFVALEAELRKASSLGALRLILVNDALAFFSATQAILLEADRATAIAHCATIDRNAPLIRLIERLARRQSTVLDGKARVFPLPDPSSPDIGPELMTCREAMLVPLHARGKTCGSLLLLRKDPWSETLLPIATALGDVAGHAFAAFGTKPRRRFWRWPLAGLAALGLAGLLALPVPLTVLAPAEIVPVSPVVIAAPIDGVIAAMPVDPDQPVRRGDVILRFHDTSLRNDVEAATMARAIAVARLDRAVHSAFGASPAEDSAITEAELKLAEAELARTRDMLARTVMTAERDGLLLYSARSDFMGKPVATGERIMQIIDPAQLELRADLAVADALALPPQAIMRFFPDGDPLRSVEARLIRAAHEATPLPDGQLAFRLSGTLEKTAALRAGMRGMARITLGEASLGFVLFRRPIAALRQHWSMP
jgi:hypothetical protein